MSDRPLSQSELEALVERAGLSVMEKPICSANNEDHPMSEAQNYRHERIERLLNELRHEIERGMLEREIDETMGFRFYVPRSRAVPDGVVFCEFRTRPIPRWQMAPGDIQPRLKLVKNSEAGSETPRRHP